MPKSIYFSTSTPPLPSFPSLPYVLLRPPYVGEYFIKGFDLRMLFKDLGRYIVRFVHRTHLKKEKRKRRTTLYEYICTRVYGNEERGKTHNPVLTLMYSSIWVETAFILVLHMYTCRWIR